MVRERRGSRRRRWLVGGAVVFVVLAGAWWAIERAIDVEQYHRKVENELVRITGLPVTIDRLDLALRPIPCVSVIGLSIGSGEFHATSSRVNLYPAFHALLWRHLDILSIQFDELVLTLPRTVDAAKRAWSETRQHATQAFEVNDAPGSVLAFVERVDVHVIGAGDALLRLGAAGPVVLVASVEARGITSDQLELELAAGIPDTAVRGEGTLLVPLADSDPTGLRGRFDLRELRPHRFFELPRLLHTKWRARFDVTAPTPDSVRVDVEGEFAPEVEDSLGGTLTGRAQFHGDAPPTAEFDVAGEGLALQVAARVADQTTLRIDRFRASGATLSRLLTLAVSGDAKLVASPDATLSSQGLTLAFGPDGMPRFSAGVIETRGLGFEWNGRVLADDLRFDGSLVDGVLVVTDLRGGPLALRGTLRPGPAWGHVDLALSGTLRLEDAWLRALVGTDSLRDASGTLRIDALAGRFPPAPDTDPLTVRAHMIGGNVRFTTGEIDEMLSDIALDLSDDESRIFVEGRARSPRLGALEMSVTLDPTGRSARGNVTADPGALAALVADPYLRERVAPLLRAYRRSRIAFGITLSDEPGVAANLRVERFDAPHISARLAVRTAPEERLGDVDLTAEVPAEGLGGWLPEGAQATGSGAFQLRRAFADRSFTLTADLGGLGIATGRLVEKLPGEALTIQIDGGAGPAGWVPRRFGAKGALGTLSFAIEAGGIVAPDLDVDLSHWDFLLVDAARASGRIRGSVSTPTGSARLDLVDVGLHLSPEVGVDSIEGEVAIAGDDWRLRDLRIRGANSDAVLNASRTGDRLEGRLEGASLDVDFVRALYAEIDALRPPSSPTPALPPLSGTFGIRLDRVGYGRSEAHDLRANVELRDGDASVGDLAFETYDGRVGGAISIDARDGAPSLLEMNLDIADVSGRFLDDMFAAEPRGVRGHLDGKFVFAAPLLGDWKSLLASADGFLEATARDGGFGRIRIATKILTVLRSTEALRLKAPAWKDGGLVFDTTHAGFTLEQGRLTVNRFDLDSTSYAMTASGYIDFRKEESRVPIEVDVTRGFTGIMGRLPVAHEALAIAKIRLVATGSPYDLKVGMASFKDQLIGAGAAAPKAAIKRVGDALRRPSRPAGEAPATDSEAALTAPTPETLPTLEAESPPASEPEASPPPETEASPTPEPDGLDAQDSLLSEPASEIPEPPPAP